MTVRNSLIVGEVLFDVFPDQQKILGGAPFNVAWHLQGLGLNPTLFSRVGDDANGHAILQAMRAWSMNTDLIQIDSHAPTGIVDINMHPVGGHSFSIRDHQAWDNLTWPEQLSNATSKNTAWLYHGSLALRHSNNNKIIARLKEQGLPAFLDINLRTPWWESSQIQQMMLAADWVKLNDEELAQLSEVDINDAPDWRNIIPQVHQRYALSGLILTCGAQGAWIYDGKQLIFNTPPPVDSIADTVGAGDAFTAICLFGLSKQWPLQTILDRALAFAASVCLIKGATTNEHTFYERFLTQWK